MRTVFMGSPEFAVPCLRALAQRTQVLAVACQPDKPAGRGQRLSPPAVKGAALELGLPVLQPPSLRPDRSEGAAFLQELQALAPELVVVVAYGKILPPAVLAVPPRGCWNVHGSLLPRYRGAAPIQWGLLRGDGQTGVTLMQMDAGMDTGPMLLKRALDIREDDTAGTLHEKLSGLGAELLAEGLARLIDGTLPAAEPQDPAQATMAPMLDKEHGRADFHRPAALVCGQLRGVDPWPGAYAPLRVREEELALKLFQPRLGPPPGRPAQPGEVLGVGPRGLQVACGPGGAESVYITELQLPGRKRLPAAALCAGQPIPAGTLLGGGPNPLLG